MISILGFLSHQLQSLAAQPHYLDGFEVLYRSLLLTDSDWEAKNVSLPSFQTQVGPLKRGYNYEFKVRPYGSNLYGRESNTQHFRVPEKGNRRVICVVFCFIKLCFTELEYKNDNTELLIIDE